MTYVFSTQETKLRDLETDVSGFVCGVNILSYLDNYHSSALSQKMKQANDSRIHLAPACDFVLAKKHHVLELFSVRSV